MADVKMPEFVPCKFNEKGWAPCRKPSTNGFCSEHENLKCVSCGERALRSCDEGMGGLACGATLCATCQHSWEGGGTHVGGLIYKVQTAEQLELLQTGRESKRMLASRGVPWRYPLPNNLKDLLDRHRKDFTPKINYLLLIKNSSMGTFPAILKDTKIVVITPDREAIIRVWSSLPPRDSEIYTGTWMIHGRIGIGYRMCSDQLEQKESRPCKIFTAKKIAAHFTRNEHPFEWAPGLFGAEVSQQRFDALIQKELAA